MFTLSDDQWRVFEDLAYFEHRAAIETQLTAFFKELQTDLEVVTQSFLQVLPMAAAHTPPRYGRGEHYRGAPYRVLDCPAVFGPQGYFAYRCALLWGRCWTAQLLLAGPLAEPYRAPLAQYLETSPTGLRVSAAETPWRWLPDELPGVEAATDPHAAAALVRTHPFVQLCRWWPLSASGAFAHEATEGLAALLGALGRG